jgi:AcrR family transcriptional regulator
MRSRTNDFRTLVRRGRPRTFDEEGVLRNARQFFLEHGYEGSSYEQVGAAMGLSKPSLYTAFGDKPALFERVVATHASEARERIVASFEAGDGITDGARRLLLGAADAYSKPDGPSIGCLLVGTALPACAGLDGVRRTLADFTAGLEAALEQAVATRHAAEAKRAGRSPREVALLLVSLLYSLAVRARTGVSRRRLRAIADELAGVARLP